MQINFFPRRHAQKFAVIGLNALDYIINSLDKATLIQSWKYNVVRKILLSTCTEWKEHPHPCKATEVRKLPYFLHLTMQRTVFFLCFKAANTFIPKGGHCPRGRSQSFSPGNYCFLTYSYKFKYLALHSCQL